MRINLAYALLTLLMLTSSGLAANYTSLFFCANLTTLNQTATYYDATGELVTNLEMRSLPCAWGCVGGECLDGSALAFNSFITLLVYWGVAVVLFWLATQLDPAWELTITIFNGAAIGLMIIGILAVIMIYPPAAGTLSAVVPGLYLGITDSIPYVLIALCVMFVAVWLVRRLDYNKIRKGE